MLLTGVKVAARRSAWLVDKPCSAALTEEMPATPAARIL
jgi:hypothetical protein